MAETIPDGQTNFIGGQDASVDPSNVAPNSYFAGVNVRCEKALLKPRWAYKARTLNFPDESLSIGGSESRSYENIFSSGKFQAIIPYVNGTEYCLIIVICGIIFLYNIRTNNISVINIADGSYLNEDANRIKWSPAGRFLVIFDFPAYPVVIENGLARRADPLAGEVPISNLGAYNQNRLFIANAGNEFTGGDPSGSLATPDAPITFFEVLIGGPYVDQFFQLSTNYNNDPITAMAFLQVSDTSTGLGSLLVSTQTAVYSYLAQIPRAQWEFSTFGTNFIYNNGIAGQRAFANVNSDLFYISADGQLRAASMSRDEQKKWSKTPLSREVENWLVYHDKDIIPLGNVAYFHNKIFATANPFRTKALTVQGRPTSDYAYGGFVVLGTENVAKLGQAGTPAWDGLWTGIRPMDSAVCNEKFFVMSKDEEFQNVLYEVDPNDTVDVVKGKQRYVESIIYTRDFSFQDEFMMKQLHSMQVELESVQGDFRYRAHYKPDHGTFFTPWVDFEHKAPWRTCDVPTPRNINGLAPQSFGFLNFGSPPDNVCNPVTKQFYHTFEKVQLRLQITGKYWELHGIKLRAERPRSENTTETPCNGFPTIEVPQECFNDWAIPQGDLCRSYQT